jgi:hypothetical protein
MASCIFGVVDVWLYVLMGGDESMGIGGWIDQNGICGMKIEEMMADEASSVSSM